MQIDTHFLTDKTSSVQYKREIIFKKRSAFTSLNINDNITKWYAEKHYVSKFSEGIQL